MKNDAQKLRDFFEKVKVFPAGQNELLAKASGIKRSAVRYTLRDFIARGEIEEENGMLKYTGRNIVDTLIDRVWKAWRYSNTWSVAEIAKLTGGDATTIRSYVADYMNAGYIEKVGVKKGYKKKENLYRLIKKERMRPCVKN